MKTTGLSAREKNILRLAILVVAAGLVFNFALSPLIGKVTGIGAEISRKEYILKKYAYFQEKSRALNLAGGAAAMDLTKSLSNDAAIDEMFSAVSEAARKYALRVQKIKPLPVGSAHSSKQAVLEVEVVGSFSAIFNFIDAVEESPLFVRVFTFHLAASGNDGGLLRCTIAFSRVF